MVRRIVNIVLGIAFSVVLLGQEKIVPIPFGHFDQWTTRNIRESKALGGSLMQVYAVGPQQIVDGTLPYDKGDSPWGSSNVIATVMGITKTSTTVFPEKRDNGCCARLETRLTRFKVLGIVNFALVISGSLYLGTVKEPIREIDKPYNQVDFGIPFTDCPKAFELDYKVQIRNDEVITQSTLLETKELKGTDPAEVFILLQRRWEDKRGDLYAHRVGTAAQHFEKSTPSWINNFRIPFLYGDISKNDAFRPYMKLRSEYGAKNSRGRIVPVREIGWGDASEKPTHMVLIIQSGSLGAYVGALDNTFWVDNAKLVY